MIKGHCFFFFRERAIARFSGHCLLGIQSQLYYEDAFRKASSCTKKRVYRFKKKETCIYVSVTPSRAWDMEPFRAWLITMHFRSKMREQLAYIREKQRRQQRRGHVSLLFIETTLTTPWPTKRRFLQVLWSWFVCVCLVYLFLQGKRRVKVSVKNC